MNGDGQEWTVPVVAHVLVSFALLADLFLGSVLELQAS